MKLAPGNSIGVEHYDGFEEAISMLKNIQIDWGEGQRISYLAARRKCWRRSHLVEEAGVRISNMAVVNVQTDKQNLKKKLINSGRWTVGFLCPELG